MNKKNKSLSLESCYLCNSIDNLTDDHIPPDGFFPPPKPNNLITIKCCQSCNNSFSQDDEAFRIFASSQINRSVAGEWIWNHKVMESSFKRSPKLKANVKNSLVPIKRDINSGDVITWGLQYPIKRGENFLMRLTKGLIKFYYPKIDYSSSKFKITHLDPTQEVIDNTLSKFVYDQRGEGVFRVWRVLIDNEKAASVWVYIFYDALMFMVEVDLDENNS